MLSKDLRPPPPWALAWRRDDAIKRATWPSGPWDDEPDEVSFREGGCPYPLALMRGATTGCLCGYVGVSPEHPAFGVSRDALKRRVLAHGLITYAERSAMRNTLAGLPEGADVWWIGFDCSHAYDVWPAIPAEVAAVLFHRPESGYRDVEYARQATLNMARQLLELRER